MLHGLSPLRTPGSGERTEIPLNRGCSSPYSAVAGVLQEARAVYDTSLIPVMNALTAGSKGHQCCRGSPAHSLCSFPQLGRSCRGFLRLAVTRWPSRIVVQPRCETGYAVQLRAVDEAAQQSYTLSLRTADPLTATGLVHRTLVAEAQNARRVSSGTHSSGAFV